MGKKKSRKYNWNDPNAPPRPNKQKKPATTLDYYESDSEDSLTLDNPVSYSFEDHVSDNETESNPGYVQLVKVNIRQVSV
jgi:hypothetical protein